MKKSKEYKMKTSQHCIAFAITIALSLLSCNESNEDAQQNQSNLKHTYGHTEGVISTPRFTCKDDLDVVNMAAKAPKTTQYLNNMMLDVMKRSAESGLKTFKGNLDPSLFCIRVWLTNTFNAKAIAQVRKIMISSEMLLQAPNHAFLAAVVTHEMAHIALQHDSLFPEHTFPLVYQNERALITRLINEQKSELENLQKQKEILLNITTLDALITYDELDRKLTGLHPREVSFWKTIQSYVNQNKLCNNQCQKWNQALNSIVNSIKKYESNEAKKKAIALKYYTKEEVANQMEVDADNIGLEFYARSDYSLDMYRKTLESLNRMSPNGTHPCTRGAPRGTSTHPRTCWRLLNILDELNNHQTEYSALQTESSVNRFAGPSLQDVKKEIVEIYNIINSQSAQ